MVRTLAAKTIATGALAMTMIFSACSNESPLGQNQVFQNSSNMVQSNVGPISLIRSNPLRLSLGSESGKQPAYQTKEHIGSERGGTITVGSDESGYASVTFPAGALAEDTEIGIRWNTSGVNMVELSPHGISFLKPVLLRVSYKTADLTGVTEDEIRVFYDNDAEGIWELVGGLVDQQGMQVSAQLQHFSEYALGSE